MGACSCRACMTLTLSKPRRRFGLGTLLGYPYTWIAVGAILTTAVLGLIVSLSTFLVIGATSSVTFNVVRALAEFCRLLSAVQPCRCRTFHRF